MTTSSPRWLKPPITEYWPNLGNLASPPPRFICTRLSKRFGNWHESCVSCLLTPIRLDRGRAHPTWPGRRSTQSFKPILRGKRNLCSVYSFYPPTFRIHIYSAQLNGDLLRLCDPASLLPLSAEAFKQSTLCMSKPERRLDHKKRSRSNVLKQCITVPIVKLTNSFPTYKGTHGDSKNFHNHSLFCVAFLLFIDRVPNYQIGRSFVNLLFVGPTTFKSSFT